MGGYSPLKITGMEAGLVQQREEFLLPDDAYPRLQNAYVWRERILRKKGYELLGRLQRDFVSVFMGANSSGTVGLLNNNINYITNITQANPGVVTTLSRHHITNGQTVGFSQVVGMTQVNGNGYTATVIDDFNFSIVNTSGFSAYVSGGITVSANDPFSVDPTIVVGVTSILAVATGVTYTDNGMGVMIASDASTSGTINYITGVVLLPIIVNSKFFATFSYYPNLPVMGIRTRERQNSLSDQTIFFDQVYAYIFNASTNVFQEFIPGVYWNNALEDVDGTSFFWSTNYWVSQTTIPGTSDPLFTTTNQKLFWETNNTGQFGANSDPIRITDGITWVDFVPPNFGQIDATNFLVNCLSFLPFRGRMVCFNTWEGTDAANAQQFSNRIRWSTIGNPFIPYNNGPPATGSWRDDIRGQGGFLDIPTSEDIISVGFVRDNLVIYCERSTWQLRYTGRSIAPFQIERVNSELGGEGPFSAVQFDTSLVGIGDKGIVECDSYQSQRIDIKIPDFVFTIQSQNNGAFRVHGVRDFINRLAFWTIPLSSFYDPGLSSGERIYPNIRLSYNYENDSWALFNDSLTCMGTYQPQTSRNWLNTPIPWIRCNFAWIATQQQGIPAIVGGNQQGFVEYLDEITTNDPSLMILGITANTTTPTVVTSPNHNMSTGFVIGISGIPTGTPFDNLNGGIFGIIFVDEDSFQLMKFDPVSGQFSNPQLDNFIASISNITKANPAQVTTSTPTTLVTGDQITIYNVVGMTQVNGNTYTITVIDSMNFTLNGVNSTGYSTYISGGTIQFPYIGGGVINIRENFSILSKKFNFLDEGQSIQLGFIDILMSASELEEPGAITLKVYLDYNENEASNLPPQNEINDYSPNSNPDTFFNSVIPTTSSTLNGKGGSKFWQRVFCSTRANFLTLEYTLSNAQLAGIEQEQSVQIDAQVLHIRRAGRMTQI